MAAAVVAIAVTKVAAVVVTKVVAVVALVAAKQAVADHAA